MKSNPDSRAGVESFVVRVYRREERAAQVAGTVQRAGGDARPFHSAEELWSALTDLPQLHNQRGKGQESN